MTDGRYARALHDTDNGVYLIRNRQTKELLYVGESHSNRLYGTATRHFQRWSDKYDTAGATYDPDNVDIAVLPFSPDDATDYQDAMIWSWFPEDNHEPDDPPKKTMDLASLADKLDILATPF